MASKLGNLPLGGTVKLWYNGSLRDFIVVHQGKPSPMYDESCNGTWLLMKEVYSLSMWDAPDRYPTGENNYGYSTIHAYLNGAFFSAFSANAQSVIKQVKIPYRPEHNRNGDADYHVNFQLATGPEGLPCKVFLLSAYEAGWTTAHDGHLIGDGAKLAYFNANGGPDAKRAAGTEWWMRTPCVPGENAAWVVKTDGGLYYYDCNVSKGVRPAVILPSTMYISDDGTVSANRAPAAPTWLQVATPIKGGASFGVTWGGASDADGNLQGYYLERSIEGGAWTQIYQGAQASTTDLIQAGQTVSYRVKSYDTDGAASGWYQGGTNGVVWNAPPPSPAALNLPERIRILKPVAVSWPACADPDGDPVTYELERAVNAAAFERVYTGAALSYGDTAGAEWYTVQYRVRAVDSKQAASSYQTSPARNVERYVDPTITGQDTDLGDVTAPPSYDYQVDDADAGDTLTVTEQLDGVTLRTISVAHPGVKYTFAVEPRQYLMLEAGPHRMTVTVTDSHANSATRSITFTRVVAAIDFDYGPLPVDAKPTQALVTLSCDASPDSVDVRVCNNAYDSSPAWEAASPGRKHPFANTANTAGRWGVMVRVRILPSDDHPHIKCRALSVAIK